VYAQLSSLRVHQYVDFRAAYCPKYVKVRTSTRIGGVRGFSTWSLPCSHTYCLVTHMLDHQEAS
jgi:hypothetical protein